MTNENMFEEFDESKHTLQSVLSKYLPYWPLFVLLMILSLIGAFIYLKYATPIYESTSKILIKDEKKGLDDSKIMESLDMFGSKKIVENEIEVIKSVELTSNVVRNLRLYAPISQQTAIKDLSGYLNSPVLVELAQPDSLIETEKEFFEYDSVNRTVRYLDKAHPVNDWFESPFGTMRFIFNKNYQRPQKQHRLYFSLVSVYKTADELLNDLDVEAASKQATIIYIKLKDPISRRSENIIDELIAEYNKAAIEDKNVLAANTLNFVNARLDYVVSELDSVELQIQRYKNKNSIVDISEQGKLFLESAERRDEEISRNTVQLAVLDEVQKYVSGQSDKSGIIPSTLGVVDPVLTGLLSQLYAAELRYNSLRKSTAENHPVLLALAEEINSIKPKILHNIETQRQSLKAGTTSVGSERERYAAVLRGIPQKERELLQISRQQSIKNSIYTFLLQKREETALSLASTVADSRLVDRAHSTILPISPKKLPVLLIALTVGFVTAIAIVSLRENLSTKILFRSEIEALTSIPIIGEIALDKTNIPIVVEEGKRNAIAEQFRQLRTSLSYIGINSGKKKVLITSTESGEGKSFITANLGMTLAMTGKKVVLIELDLRKPKLSAIFDLKNTVGITNYLIGAIDIDQMIKESMRNPNLFIIPSGPIPPNPSELILNGKLEELLENLSDRFDYIVIDTAPVSPVTDAYILSPLCDATLYVVRHGTTSKYVIHRLEERRKLGGLKNVAIVFNGIKGRGIGRYGYDYGYGYGNGYDYAEDDQRKKKKHKKPYTNI